MVKRFACCVWLVGCASQGGVPTAQSAPAQCASAEPAQVVAVAQPAAAAQPPVAAPPPAAKDNGLDDFAALTFGCPKAALNAAAREAAKVPSEGSYQFTHFDFISDTHQAVYEVHFASNYPGEPVLRYCVAIYCQNGWDPKNTQASVTLMAETGATKKTSVHGAACGGKHTHAAARRVE